MLAYHFRRSWTEGRTWGTLSARLWHQGSPSASESGGYLANPWLLSLIVCDPRGFRCCNLALLDDVWWFGAGRAITILQSPPGAAVLGLLPTWPMAK